MLEPDPVVEVEIGTVEGIGKALLVKRFDRTDNGQKLHFEEFAQLLKYKSKEKYDGSEISLYLKSVRE